MSLAVWIALFAVVGYLLYIGRVTPRSSLHDGDSSRNGLYVNAWLNEACANSKVHGCTSFMRNAGGHFIHVRSFPSLGAVPKALVFVFHGWAEHLGRHRLLIDELRESFDVVALDWQGHGFSSGDVAFDIDALADDAAQLIASVHEQRAAAGRPALKSFLFAHSMGGLVAVNTVLRRGAHLRIDAVALSSPLLFPDPEKATPLLVAIADVLSTLLPNLPVVSPVTADISDSADVRNAYDADPLVFHKGMPARTAASILRTIANVDAGAGEFDKPLLIVHGTDDRLCKFQGSKDFIGKVGSKDKKLHTVEGGWHETMWGAKERAVVTAWLQKQL
jgi:acylglycerol lipase